MVLWGGYVYVLALLFLALVSALEAGDRISTMSQTFHNGYKTSWADVPIQQMPRFRVQSSSVLHLTLPRPPPVEDLRAPLAKLVNPSEDVKFSLTFADHKLILPWTVVFDASKRRSLQKLTVMFSHDQFDVDGIEFETEYGGKIARLDPEHPSLTAFEIVFKWRGVSGEDFSMGVFIMFILCLVSLVLLSVFVYANYEGPILNSKSKQSAPPRGSSSSSHRDSSSSSSSESVSASSPLSGSAIRRHHSGYRSPKK